MRRAVLCLLLAFAGGAVSAKPAPHRAAAPPQADAPPSGPPHAWLYGSWTGGLFPVIDGMAAQDCRTQPTVSFTKDAVTHSTLLGTATPARSIETVRATPGSTEFRFLPADPPDPDAGFGCETANVLHVTHGPGGTISFPNCKAFPYPLQRCSGP